MKRKLFFYGFTALLFFCAAAYGKEDRHETRRSFAVNPGASITLRNISGDIRISSWDRSEVEMVAVKTGDADNFDRVVSIIARPSNLDIRTQYPDNISNVNLSVQYDLKVPRNVVLDNIETISGNIEITGIDGEVTAKTVSGDVRVSRISRKISLNNVSGDIHVSDITGSSAINTVSGDIRINRVGSSVRANSFSGDINIESSAYEINLTASVFSGSIRFNGRLNPDGLYKINSFSGDVTLNLPADSNFVIDATTSKGSIKSDFDIKGNRETQKKGERLKGVVGSDGPPVILSTSSGSIQIRKTAKQ